ncbi:hypothetical protein [Haliangium sp. UPWRP_2]|uniref:hypothetical protein n=1 Tax=Haliangium sp. UPWRP_2 TaxID=1931276 RepID=UPI000B53E755|nr:hypothetical protein [Haliangium sp. UPWRP_2]PSM32219.1 hypothetical protein BVG81_001270 [Haliangium sp. UPWRP_2]
MSDSPQKAAATAAAPYTPSGAAASERMLSSVLGRVIGPYGAPIGRALRFADRVVDSVVDGGGASAGRGATQRLFAQPVFSPPPAAEPESASAAARPRRERSVPTQELLTAHPAPRPAADLKLPRALRPAMALSSPERMFGPDSKSASDGSAGPDRRSASSRPAPTLLSSGWEPPAAPAARERETLTVSPLWSSLRRPTLEPLIAAVESDLGQSPPPAQPPQKEPVERRERPAMALLAGGRPSGPQSAITEEQAHKAAVEASRRLMEAVRVHAAAHGGADDRISLGDMTLIAFADSNKQMAAASAYTSNAPEPRPVAKALGQQAHPKLKEDQKDLHNKLRAMAKLVIEDLNQVKKLSKERFGAHG